MANQQTKLVRVWGSTLDGAGRLMRHWAGRRKPKSIQQLLDWLVQDALEALEPPPTDCKPADGRDATDAACEPAGARSQCTAGMEATGWLSGEKI